MVGHRAFRHTPNAQSCCTYSKGLIGLVEMAVVYSQRGLQLGSVDSQTSSLHFEST
jgi:hypothetical protein